MIESMDSKELDQTLRHCHKALGDALQLISDIFTRKGEPDDILKNIKDVQTRYNQITKLLNAENR